MPYENGMYARGLSWTNSEIEIILRVWSGNVFAKMPTLIELTRSALEKAGFQRTDSQIRVKIGNLTSEYRQSAVDPTKLKKHYFIQLQRIFAKRSGKSVDGNSLGDESTLSTKSSTTLDRFDIITPSPSLSDYDIHNDVHLEQMSSIQNDKTNSNHSTSSNSNNNNQEKPHPQDLLLSLSSSSSVSLSVAPVASTTAELTTMSSTTSVPTNHPLFEAILKQNELIQMQNRQIASQLDTICRLQTSEFQNQRNQMHLMQQCLSLLLVNFQVSLGNTVSR